MKAWGPLQSRDQALQKHGYKVLAYLCQERPDFLRSNFAAIVASLKAGVATALSAAKRYRLVCLQAVILALQSPEASSLHLPPDDVDSSEESPANQVLPCGSSLVNSNEFCSPALRVRALRLRLLYQPRNLVYAGKSASVVL